jgi:hypothetical protein
MDFVNIGNISLSRLIIGGNPFSGISHQTPEMDLEMRRYYTVDRIKRTLREAESLGINTLVARADHHIIRVLQEHWDEGGDIQWFAQTCPEYGEHRASVDRAAATGAKGCFIHGGVMDQLLAKDLLDEVPPVIDMILEKGMLAGVAGHNPAVHEWAESNLDIDFHMCSYYNPSSRDQRAEHVAGAEEWFLEEDRRTMTDLIRKLSRPVIHYKVMAAGRNDPGEAFEHVAKSMRKSDAVCVGVFTKDRADMIKENLEILERSLARQGVAG